MDSLLTQLASIEPIDWIAMVAGIIGVLLSIRERSSAWPLFIVCYSAYIYISLRSGYYAFGAMNAIFVLIALYGWYHWSGSKNKNARKTCNPEISRLPRKLWPFVFVFIVAGTFGVGSILSQTITARLPFWDAFAVSSAFVAQWMLSQKYIENWIFWFISDLVYITLFLNDQHWPSVILFAAFILLAFKGWLDWSRIVNSENALLDTIE